MSLMCYLGLRFIYRKQMFYFITGNLQSFKILFYIQMICERSAHPLRN